MKQIEAAVFPSQENTITVAEDKNYGGAHYYQIQNCKGFINNETQYDDTFQSFEFVHMGDDNVITPGLQSEQLVLMLLDRHTKLNARFPSAENDKMIEGLHMFMNACAKRVKDRMSRGVMGELKK